MRTFCLELTVAAGIASFTSNASAQTWQTVDDYFIPGRDVIAECMGRDSLGNVYAGGYIQIADDYSFVAALRKSSDGGATWSLIDMFSQGEAQPGYEYLGITADAAGTLYAAGLGNIGSFVRRSVDGGSTWQTVDASSGFFPSAIATDAAGNIYVAGRSSVNSAWTVRKGTSGGDSWTTVDTFNSLGWSAANGVLCHPTAGIFVVGKARGGGRKGDILRWTVRRSLDGGASWTTVDGYQLDSTQSSIANGIGMDAFGNLYVVGEANKSIKPHYYVIDWVVRKSTNGGTSWTTVDDVRPGSYPQARAVVFVAGANGNLFTIGRCNDGSGYAGGRWVVRENIGGAGTWQTVEDFQYVSDHSSVPWGATTDTAGNVFVGGWVEDATTYGHWLVRKFPTP